MIRKNFVIKNFNHCIKLWCKYKGYIFTPFLANFMTLEYNKLIAHIYTSTDYKNVMNIKFKYTCNYYMKIIMRYMIFQLKRLNFNNNINAQFPVLVSIELHRNSVECRWNSMLISHWLQLTLFWNNIYNLKFI